MREMTDVVNVSMLKNSLKRLRSCIYGTYTTIDSILSIRVAEYPSRYALTVVCYNGSVRCFDVYKNRPMKLMLCIEDLYYSSVSKEGKPVFIDCNCMLDLDNPIKVAYNTQPKLKVQITKKE